MVKVFIIIGLLLVTVGVPGLYWCSLQSDQIQQRILICKTKCGHQVDEYVQKLTGASLKANDPTTFDSAVAANMEKMTPTERRGYQQERLLADIEDLAESQESAPQNADLLYGAGWRQNVADFKSKKQLMATVQVASVTAALAGGVLFAAAFVFAIVRIVIGGIRRVIKGSSVKSTQEPPHERTKPIEGDRFVPAASPVSNVPTQTVKNPGPTAEEFRKSLVAQTESLKEAVDQLKNLTSVLQQRSAEGDKGSSRRLEKEFKAQTESFRHENDLLKKLADDIRKAVETQSADLSIAIKNSINSNAGAVERGAEKSLEIAQRIQKETAQQHADELNATRQQIDELTKAVHASASRQAQAADVSEKIAQLIDVQTESLKKEVKPLKEIVAGFGQTLEAIQTSKSSEGADAVRLYNDGLNNIKQQIDELAKIVHTSALRQAEAAGVDEKFEQLFNIQIESLKKEVEPLKEIAGSLGQALEQMRSIKPSDSTDENVRQETRLVRQISEQSLQKGDAIGKSIADLTEQVCAIREYAAKQQQRLAKLQDGYDWNLIKNFCLRVIRCVDNLDDRIAELSCSGGNTEHLLAVREELSFVLESNGVEPFGAKIDSDYRGQENRLQVLNERDETEDGNLVGRIAQVVRPGYQCRISDEYTKIVRPAHVRLYGSACLNDSAVRGR